MKTYASLWQRMGACVLDYISIFTYLIAITVVFMLLNILFDINQRLFANRIQSQLIGFLLVTLPVILYFALEESSPRQGTRAKQRFGLQVTDTDGNRMSFWKAFLRALLKFIPWEISHTLIWQIRFFPQTNSAIINYGFALVYLLIGLNIVILLMTKTHQTVYDLLAKTYVMKKTE